MGITPSRIHVQLRSPRVDVKVYVPHLERNWSTTLTADPEGASLADASGVRLRLGDRVTLGVVGRDQRRDRWELSIEPTLLEE